MTFYAPFCIPFIVGAALMFAVLLWKWGTWLYRLPRADKMLILKGIPTRRTLEALGEEEDEDEDDKDFASRCSTGASSG